MAVAAGLVTATLDSIPALSWLGTAGWRDLGARPLWMWWDRCMWSLVVTPVVTTECVCLCISADLLALSTRHGGLLW